MSNEYNWTIILVRPAGTPSDVLVVGCCYSFIVIPVRCYGRQHIPGVIVDSVLGDHRPPVRNGGIVPEGKDPSSIYLLGSSD